MTKSSKTTQVTIADPDFLERLESRLERIEAGLQNYKIIPSQDLPLSSHQFMEKTKIGKTKFFLLISSGLLEYKKIGRKIYVPTSQVAKYYAGELNLD